MLILGIILFVLVALAWAATLLIGLPFWPAIVFSVFAVLLFFGLLLFRHLRAVQRAAALERELLKQAADQAERMRPDRRPEILALQAQMKAGIDALKRSKLGGRGGKAALYALPWYVLVGPPAAGKTTAIERSGLAFAGGKVGSSKVRGTAGTRNCDWWFSRDAILLDTAGRFSIEEDDRDEWQVFLDTIKRFRPRRPIDGVVITLSLADLMNAPETQIEEVAKQLRTRVDEMMAQLEMVIPIYVMFTKADLVAGFVEFWGDYGKAQRNQPWGATFSLDDDRLEEPALAFEEEFDILVRLLPLRMLERVAKEQVAEVRARVLQFPAEFQSLRAPLSRFIAELCKPNPYSEAPIVRGFYFTSGTQTGAPIERVLANMVRGFDLRLAGASPSRAEPQSYFVTELFEKVIFPDRDLAFRSRSRVQRHTRRQAVIAALVSLVMLLVLLPGMVSFVKSRDLVDSTVADMEEARRLESTGNAKSGLGAVDLLLRRVRLLEQADQEYVIQGFWGPRSAKPLRPAVEALFLTRLRRVVEGPVREQLAGEVREVGNLVNADAANFRDAYERLKLYLMLGNPALRLDPGWAAPRLADVWSHAAQGDADQKALLSYSTYYVDKLKQNPAWAFKLDTTAVTVAQGRLSQLPLDDLRYGWLADRARDVPPIRADKIFFGPSAQYFNAIGHAEVPGLYTALGWAKVRGAFSETDANINVEPWVLGQEQFLEQVETGSERLRELYYQRYVQSWSEFLNAMDVMPPRDMETAIVELRTISEADGPYVRLFRTLSDNVKLEEDPSLKEKLIGKAKELIAKASPSASAAVDAGAPPPREITPVERHFEPLVRFAFGDTGGAAGGAAAPSVAAPSGLSQYLAQLSSLEVALSELSETNDDPTLEFETELSRTAASVKRLLGGLDTTTRIMLEPLLMNPIRGSQEGVSKAAHGALGEDWTQAVWNHWNTTLAPRFPFANTKVDASVAELADFLRPETGLLWAFFEKNLTHYLEPSGDNFVLKNPETRVPFRGDFLSSCLSRGKIVTEALFGAGTEPVVAFTVNIHPAGSNISEIALIIDGVRTVYRNEPERWQPASWPGKGAKKGAILKVKGAGFTEEIPREGEFGLFRLLAAGGLKPAEPSKPGVLQATWNLSRAGEPPVTIELKPTKSSHPFSPGFFNKMSCPATIMSGGGL